jgi:uncharacterized protein (TIGR03437 family)
MRFLVLAILVSTVYGADFTTYIGDANQYQVAAITTDSAGSTYVTGSRFIALAAPQSSDDVFVTKLDATGKIVFTTTFGGKGIDYGTAIALDPSGNIWIGGITSSENFPLRDAFQTALGTGSTGFLVKLAPDGTFIYSSFFGGLMGNSAVNGIAVDQDGALYVTGSTDSTDFPTTPSLLYGTVSADEITPVSGAFVTKLNSTGLTIMYSALIVGNAVDCSGGSSCFLMQRLTSGVAIAVDPAGEAFVAGNSNTTDLPVTPGGSPGYGAFVLKINTGGSQLVYFTYIGPAAGIVSLGPAQTIAATAIAADSTGDAYVTGYTDDPQFPATPGAFQTKLDADASTGDSVPFDAFAMKLNPAGTTIGATYLGGPATDLAYSISLDSSGNVWLVGGNGAGFPTGNPASVALAGDFLVEFSADGSKLLYSEEFPQGGAGQGVDIDQSGVVHVAGDTGLVSTITPGQPSTARIGGIANAAAGEVSGRVSPGEVISIFGFEVGPATPVKATPGSNGLFPTSLGGVEVLLNGAAIPLLYVSATQINAEIPAPLSDSDTVLQIVNNAGTLPDFRVSVDASIFGIFLKADGSIAALNQDGTVNSSSNPAPGGSIVTIWATGFGNADGPLVGAVATTADNWCSMCEISVNDVSETVAYGGTAPGLIDGIMQINFMIPEPPVSGATQAYLQFTLGGTGFIWVSQ